MIYQPAPAPILPYILGKVHIISLLKMEKKKIKWIEVRLSYLSKKKTTYMVIARQINIVMCAWEILYKTDLKVVSFNSFSKIGNKVLK